MDTSFQGPAHLCARLSSAVTQAPQATRASQLPGTQGCVTQDLAQGPTQEAAGRPPAHPHPVGPLWQAPTTSIPIGTLGRGQDEEIKAVAPGSRGSNPVSAICWLNEPASLRLSLPTCVHADQGPLSHMPGSTLATSATVPNKHLSQSRVPVGHEWGPRHENFRGRLSGPVSRVRRNTWLWGVHTQPKEPWAPLSL